MFSKSRALFLDRDGVINVDHEYVGQRERFEFMPGLFPFLSKARDRGFRLVIVTNQAGVARGLFTEADYDDLTAWMLGEMAKEGVSIDAVMACFEIKEGTVARYARESYWRKPNPGMILAAAQRLRLDLGRSVMIGDSAKDMEAAKAAGVGVRLLLAREGKAPSSAAATGTVGSFAEAEKMLYTKSLI